MIFAKFQVYPNYKELLLYLKRFYPKIEFGQQCDDWIRISEDDENVDIDNFLSDDLEIKSEKHDSLLVRKIIAQLQVKYPLRVCSPPNKEPHEN